MREILHGLYTPGGDSFLNGNYYIVVDGWPWLAEELLLDSKKEEWLFPYDTALVTDK